MQTVTIGKNQAGQRFDKFLHKYLPEAGNAFLYKMLRKKNITLNGKKAEGKEILSEGDVVESFFSEETFAKFSGRMNCENLQDSEHLKHSQKSQCSEDSDYSKYSQFSAAYKNLKGISILYEDDNIIIANKPAGVLTQKARPEDLALNEWLIGYLLSGGGISKEELATFHPSVCNRLDRNTSGIVLCGKSLAGSRELSRIIKDHSLRKFYRTICVGEIKEDMVLEGSLKKDRKTNKVTVKNITEDTDIRTIRESIKRSIKRTGSLAEASNMPGGGEKCGYIRTAFHPIAHGNGYTYLEVELFTGKTHQIRAQLAAIGHPVIGDFKYGDKRQNQYFQEKYGLKNHLLHAHHVIFPEQTSIQMSGKTPVQAVQESVLKEVTGDTFTAPCPKLFERIIGENGLKMPCSFQ